MNKRIVILLLCLCLFWGCTPQNHPNSTPSPTVNSPILETEDGKLYTQLFDIHNKVTIQLHMSEDQLRKMQEDYNHYDAQGSKSPIYRMGDLTITIQTPDGNAITHQISQVGVRMKGNTSRTAFYSEEEGIYNIIHLKISFQETFDDEAYYGKDAIAWEKDAREERKGRTFATLEKLDLRWNRCDDSTYLKEYFAYETYRNYGVPAPRTNLCSFDWAGVHMGVFTLNEPVDQAFLEKRLPAEALGGDLYKCGWAGNHNASFTSATSIGIEDEDAKKFYAYDLKTNKKKSQHESLKGFIQGLNQGNVTKERFESLVDLNYFLPYAAVSYLLGNPDDLRNNYNNCYIYFRADNGKMLVIPYDYDRCLGITTHWNPTGTAVTDDNPFTDELQSVDRWNQGADRIQKSPLFQYSVQSGGYFVREYATILEQIIKGDWFTYENFADIYRTAESHYQALARPVKAFRNCDGLELSFDLDRTSDFSSHDNISIRDYLTAKIDTLSYYLDNLDQYISSNPSAPEEKVWYIRADFTGWQNDDRYLLEESNGLYTYRLKASGQVRLKIYNNKTDQWFGTECIQEECTVPYETDGHTNIILEKGEYRIIFDPVALTIMLEMEN